MKLNTHRAMQGEDLQPAPSPGDLPPMPNHPANSPFRFRFHPKRWGVMAGKLVPMLNQWTIEPGLGGVERDGAWRRAAAEMQEKGWKLIPLDVDGPGTSYVKTYPVSGGTLHLPQWALVWAGSDQVGCDEEAYTEWLQSLVERGVVPGPAPYVLTALIEKQEARLAGMLDQLHANPSLKPQIEVMQETIAVMRAGLVEPKPEEALPGKPMRRSRKTKGGSNAEEA
jgi:hypothetical protein